MSARALLLTTLFVAVGGFSQKLDPAKWSLELDPAAIPPGGKVLARLKAVIEPGWHLYSLTTPAAKPTTIRLTDNTLIERIRVLQPMPKRAFDPTFKLDSETFEGEAIFLIEAHTKKGAAPGPSQITAEVRYQTCNDRLCLPPRTRTASATLSIDGSAKPAELRIPPEYTEFNPGAARAAAPPPARTGGDSGDLAVFLLTAFGFGLASIFTPCVRSRSVTRWTIPGWSDE